MKREVRGAQGEITFFKVDRLPENLKAHTEKDGRGRPIISHSESGHHHVLDADVHVLERTDAPPGMRILYALLEQPAALVQDANDAHGQHHLDAGIYEFRIAREYDPFEDQVRQVAD